MNRIHVSRATAGVLSLAIVACLGGAQGGSNRGPDAGPRGQAANAPDVQLDAQPAAPILLDVIGGVASTHIIVRTPAHIAPVRLTDGRWGFAARDIADHRQIIEVAAASLQPPEVALANLLQRERITAIGPALSVAPQNEDLARDLGLDRYYKIEVPHGTNTPVLADAIRAAAPIGAFFETVELDGIGGVAAPPPNDPLFSQQYGLHNTGQLACSVAGTPGADINALAAWDITTGSDQVIVAVLDSGVDAHTDLAGRLVPGHNVVTPGGGTADGCSHGTHVAGIIAANVNNALGIAGLTWEGKIMPVVVLNGCSGTAEQLGQGVIWATDAGAHVLNMSLQYGTPSNSFLHNAVQYAYGSGVTLVAAAGNFGAFGVCTGQTCVAFPARFPETIAVAATTNNDLKWSGSNEGPELAVAAPGFCIRSLEGPIGYSNKSGTSFAAPHVSGTTALMLALDPTLTPDEIRTILEATAKDLGTPGHNNQFGHGRIDAHAALLEVQAGLNKLGDLTGDGTVGVADLLILLAAWGPCADCTPGECPADLSGNCAVGVADLLILLENWG